MTRWYLDSSVALHAVLPGGDPRARKSFESVLAVGDELWSATLLGLEMTRVLRRERRDLSRVRLVLDRISQISIDDQVIMAAASIEPHIRSLDAIHLATCQLLGEGTTVVTHDRGMADVAGQLGFQVTDPIAA